MLEEFKKKYTNDFYLVMDKSYFPYGNKDYNTLFTRLCFLIDYLINKRVSRIVVACNTLCTKVLEDVRPLYNIELISIIDIVIDYIKTLNIKSISLIGTKNTIDSYFYQNELKKLNIICNPIIGDDLIYDIENNKKINIDKLKIKDEYLILGCTHFIKYKNQFKCKTISQDDLLKIKQEITIKEI